MKIHLATDHAGFDTKEHIKQWLINTGYEIVDHGAHTFDAEDDYPDFITPCAQAVAEDDSDMGIIFGGSGQGEAMCANRVSGVRAGVYYGREDLVLQLLREHNNANILSIGARLVTDLPSVEKAVHTFITTAFLGEERHDRRIHKF